MTEKDGNSHLSCDHETRFIFKDDILTVAKLVIDEASAREGKQEYCWENIAIYRKTWSKE